MLTTVAATGFTVAFFHAAIPTHWLPFVLVARARGWGRAKTLSVLVAAGIGHVALTSLLGLVIAWFGLNVVSLFAATAFLPSGPGAFAPPVVWRILWINALALVLLFLLHRVVLGLRVLSPASIPELTRSSA